MKHIDIYRHLIKLFIHDKEFSIGILQRGDILILINSFSDKFEAVDILFGGTYKRVLYLGDGMSTM